MAAETTFSSRKLKIDMEVHCDMPKRNVGTHLTDAILEAKMAPEKETDNDNDKPNDKYIQR